MKTMNKRIAAFCGSALFAFASGAAAQDIELFVTAGSGSAGKPNIIFLIDNPAKWDAGTPNAKTEIHEALYNIFKAGTFNGKAKVGLMTLAHGNSPKGGNILSAVKELDAAGNHSTYMMRALRGTSGLEYRIEKTNNSPYASAMDEAWRYFAGKAPRSGLQDICAGKAEMDFSAVGFVPDATKTDAQNLAAFCGASHTYVSPITAGTTSECQADNYVILLSNGEPDSGENTSAHDALKDLGGAAAVSPIDLPGNNNFEANWSDEYARWMQNVATPRVTSYVINVGPANPTQNKPKDALIALTSLAEEGGGQIYHADTDGKLEELIQGLVNKIIAVNSVFAASTLPVSVNVRGTNLNQVYMGVFRPVEGLKPRWPGNLKMYQLKVNDRGSVFLADADGNAAEDTENGFLADTSTSFWTQDEAVDFWDFDSPDKIPNSDMPDGKMVEKGAAAQHLRTNWGSTTKDRKLYTCVNASGSCATNNSLSGFPFQDDNTGITVATLTPASATTLTAAERTELIDWVRGKNNRGADSAAEGMRSVRASVHGDVLHSRPAVVNYGEDTDIVVFYGSNDGVVHAVRGGRDEAVDGTASGDELWGFVPPEFFKQLKTLRDNNAMAKVTEKPYFADGAIVADSNRTDDKVYLYITMRRGGRFMYALDVTTPTDPKFLWKKSEADWPELGYTWSEPKAVTVNLASGPKRVLIFGAGYDPDVEDGSTGSRKMGRGIFVVDADNGDLIWHAGSKATTGANGLNVAGMQYSIASDVTVLNRDLDAQGYIDRIYVGDTGGNIWRADIGSTSTAEWKVHHLASISQGSNVPKFLYAPDVVYGDGYDAILIGSGNREKPDDTTKNAFFMFKDTKAGKTGTTIGLSGLYDVTTVAAPLQTTLDSKEGWYFKLTGTGEKTVGGAITLDGTVFFNTHQQMPATDCKATLGMALSYQVNYKDGTSKIQGQGPLQRSVQVPGGGYPPSPVPVIVEIDGKKYQAVISGTQVYTSSGQQLETRVRSYWYKNSLQ